jgi:hypothetical protein
MDLDPDRATDPPPPSVVEKRVNNSTVVGFHSAYLKKNWQRPPIDHLLLVAAQGPEINL